MDDTISHEVEHHKTKKKKTFLRYVGMFIAFIVGFSLGLTCLFFTKLPAQIVHQNSEIREGNSQYHFINPLLECDIGSEYIGSNEGKPTKDQLQKLADSVKQEGRASFVAVYFRDLNDGPWTGINETQLFAPASLLKVPIMISLLKAQEHDPNALSIKVKPDFSSNTKLTEHFKSGLPLEASSTYRLDDLMRTMIVDSNNDAAKTLLNVITTDQVYQLFDYLHVDRPTDKTANFLSVKSYAMFFRVLFNASYLDPEKSEQALKMLSDVTFTQGIVAGVPNGTIVAHKFGERDLGDEKQLHDCGIVYAKNNPYLLCVMTRGQNYDQLASVISQISRVTYESVMLHR